MRRSRSFINAWPVLSKRDKVIIGCILVIILIILLNTSLLIWVLIRDNGFKALGDLYTRDCDQMKTIDTVVHLIVNICSSVAIAASNYCAQLLVAPTRAEVTQAHERGDWLEIGAPSFRNLLGRRINGKRKLIWSALMLSSIPLHLFWNSVLFSTIPVTDYEIALVSRDFRTDLQPWNETWITRGQHRSTYDQAVGEAGNTQLLRRMLLGNRFEHLSKQECIERYISLDVRHKDVVLVASNASMSDGLSLVPTNKNSSLLYLSSSLLVQSKWMWATGWLCSGGDDTTSLVPEKRQSWCSREHLLPQAETWTVKNYRTLPDGKIIRDVAVQVDYCLSAGAEETQAGCAIRYSSVMLLAVIACNCIKLACMWLVWKLNSGRGQGIYEPLVTQGDAIASFLSSQDKTTKEMPLVEASDLTNRVLSSSMAADERNMGMVSTSSRLRHPVRWFRSISVTHWIAIFVSYLLILVLLSISLALALRQLVVYDQSVDLGSLWRMGIGEVQPYSISLTEAWGAMSEKAFYGTALLANGSQLLLSFGWYFANSLLTRIVINRHWSQFITKRRALRVSTPAGGQRSTYFLSLPYRYSVPLLMASAIVHWLLSRSLFVVQTTGFSYRLGQNTDNGFVRANQFDGSVVGYSGIAMVLSVATLSALLIGLLALSTRKLPCREASTEDEVIRMPLAGTCSMAISSACHPSDVETDVYLLPLQWGKNELDRWSFTSQNRLSYQVEAGLNRERSQEGLIPRWLFQE
ncbi:hypothetical protein JX265_009348 [Neoarthrinium moseri]|uniref:DUF6536 domain-containing protein n=1 Tax=Neoarthrinium moseri TaxID=1658444 RepID=A0A9Q0AJB8_9PEZI|nr:hypothetical protein JX265_009348 [Neoarthrinium moseri]